MIILKYLIKKALNFEILSFLYTKKAKKWAKFFWSKSAEINLKWDILEQILFVTFEFIDKNVRLIQLAHSGKNYPKLEKN